MCCLPLLCLLFFFVFFLSKIYYIRTLNSPLWLVMFYTHESKPLTAEHAVCLFISSRVRFGGLRVWRCTIASMCALGCRTRWASVESRERPRQFGSQVEWQSSVVFVVYWNSMLWALTEETRPRWLFFNSFSFEIVRHMYYIHMVLLLICFFCCDV